MAHFAHLLDVLLVDYSIVYWSALDLSGVRRPTSFFPYGVPAARTRQRPTHDHHSTLIHTPQYTH